MISKEEKLRYGEQLRRQIKEREEIKKNEHANKRGIQKSPTQNRIISSVLPPPNYNALQNFQESPQKRFETQSYGNYGRSGAPNTQLRNVNEQNNMQPKQQYAQNTGSDNYQLNYNSNKPIKQQQQQPYQNSNQYYGSQDYQPQSRNTYDQLDHQQQQQYNSQPQNYQNHRNNPRFDAQSYGQQQQQNYPNQGGYYQKQPTQRSIQEMHGYSNQINHSDPRNYREPQYQQQRQFTNSGQQQQHNNIERPLQEIQQKHSAYRQKTLQNDQLMDIHKKGGRNLLQLQNMSVEQQQVKHKQKEEMRKQLQMQMKEAEDRKRKEIQRIKRQQLEDERKNQQYLQQQKQKLEDEQRQKNNKQRDIIEQNARNLQERKRLDEEAKEKARKQKYGHHLQNASRNMGPSRVNTPKINQKQNFSRQMQIRAQDQTTSEVSTSTVMENGFKTDVSKEFFEKQRRKNQERNHRQKNLDAVTQEIQRLKDQIDKQNQLFKMEIQKVKLQSEMAEHEKLKAKKQIQDLKYQLKKKMGDDNQRLFKALQKQQKLKYQSDDYQVPRRRAQRQYDDDNHVESLKPPKRSDQLITKKYNIKQQQERPYDSQLEQSNFSEEGGLVSLRGQSKKIPINLPNQKLSMSQLSQFARQTQYFKKDISPMQKKSNYDVHQSIVQEDEQRIQSRNINRNQPAARKTQQDSLDQMIQSRQKSRGGWGEMSSVNSDITKQIQQLLKKKQKQSYDHNNGYNYQMAPDYSPNTGSNVNNNNGRPSSHLSNAGKRALQYEGASLNTINSRPNGTLNTLDIDRINDRNEGRLNDFRKIGVESINTSNDGQLTKLDEILNRYKQTKTRV